MLRSIALVAAAGLAAVATANPLANLSDKELSLLSDEISEWKASNAGKEAAKNGYMPSLLSSEDEMVRFQNTKLEVEEQSKLNPDATFSTNNPFALMTMEEFTEWAGGASFDENQKSILEDAEENTEVASGPVALAADHRNSGCIGSVQQQGKCNSCWIFAAVGAIESARCLAGNSFIKLGEQRLVSCINGGTNCQPGYPDRAMTWVQQNGICAQRDDPYRSASGQSPGCSGQASSCTKVSTSMLGQMQKTSGVRALMNAVNKQPVAVGVYALNQTWKNYSGGILNRCDAKQADHAVLAVAYDNQSITLKNSWGASWGEQGYIRLSANGGGSSGTCAVGEQISWPTMSGGRRQNMA